MNSLNDIALKSNPYFKISMCQVLVGIFLQF